MNQQSFSILKTVTLSALENALFSIVMFDSLVLLVMVNDETHFNESLTTKVSKQGLFASVRLVVIELQQPSFTVIFR